MSFTKPISTLIQTRTSIRTYVDRPLEPQTVAALQEFLRANAVGPFRSPLRLQLIAAQPDDVAALKGLGTYGVIKHPAGFLVGAVGAGEKNLEDFGYVMERVILYATDLDLGTCWLGGSFQQSKFADRITASAAEIVPAVVSIGYAAPHRAFADRMLHRMINTTARLPWEQMFFAEHFAAPLTRAQAGTYAPPLEMLRLAPSASNKQPWRIVHDARRNAFHFYLCRTPGYNRSQKTFFKMADLQRADIGIAMCHFALTAQELGLAGTWRAADPNLTPLPERTEYIVSWVSA